MISYTTYKILHLVSMFGLLAMISYWLTLPRVQRPVRFAMITKGIVGLLVMTGGMGLMARLGVGFAPWVLAKIGIWLVVLGFSSVMIKRWDGPPWKGIAFVWAMFSLAGYLAVMKPS